MRMTSEEAIVIVAEWPKPLSGKEMLELLRQLSTLDLPERDVMQWLKKSESADNG